MMLLKAVSTNPAQFFAACGFLELAAVTGRDVKAVWTDKGLEIREDDLLFQETISMIQRLRIRPVASWIGRESVRPFDLEDEETGFGLRMDWWEKRHDGSNSSWKCFGGQLQAAKLSNDMLLLCKSFLDHVGPEDLFTVHAPSSSRLGYDPRSSWNACDTGFSPNEHKDDKNVATYPFTEFLSSIALQTFPFRGLYYYNWNQPLELIMCRVSATGGGYGDKFSFDRTKRGQLFSFNYSSITT